MQGTNEIPVTAERRIMSAAIALSQAIAKEPYAFIGGAACQLLGSARVTQDVDFVIPRGMPPRILEILGQSAFFHVTPNRKVSFVSMPGTVVHVNIMSHPQRFPERYDETTPTIIIAGVGLLHPVLILNITCDSVHSVGRFQTSL
jgi:hypothetical protein